MTNEMPRPWPEIKRLNEALTWLTIATRWASLFIEARPRLGRAVGRPMSREELADLVERRYFLLISAHKAASAVEACEAGVLDADLRGLCALMRHLEEHPDEGQVRPKGTRALIQQFPDANLASESWSNDPAHGTRVGGLFHVEEVRDQMSAAIAPIQAKLDGLMQQVGLYPYLGPTAAEDIRHPPQSSPERAADAYYRGMGRSLFCYTDGDDAIVLYLADNAADGCERFLHVKQEPEGWLVYGMSSGDRGFTQIEVDRFLAYRWGGLPCPPRECMSDGARWFVVESTDDPYLWLDDAREIGVGQAGCPGGVEPDGVPG